MHTDPEFEFPHDGGIARVYRHVLVGSGPYWYLTWEGHGVAKLSSRSDESLASLRQRVQEWLDRHLSKFSYKGMTYHVYKTPVEEWIRREQPQVPEAFWHAVQGATYLLQFPCSLSEPVETVREAVINSVNEQAVECYGGPLDGERVGERGEEFRVLEEDQKSIRVANELRGRYRRGARGYEWTTD